MDLTQMMTEEELSATGADLLTSPQQMELAAWGMKMFTLGQYRVSDTEEIKYGGRLMILQDGSKWEVKPTSQGVVEIPWGSQPRLRRG